MDDDYIWNRLDIELAQLGAGIAMDKEPDGSARVALTAKVPALDGGTHLRLIQVLAPTMKEAAGAAVRAMRSVIAVAHAEVQMRDQAWRPVVGAQA